MAEARRGRVGLAGAWARKIAVVLALAGATAGLARLRAGPAGDTTAAQTPSARAAAALAAALGAPVREDALRFSAPFEPGQPASHVAYFTAATPGAKSADIYRAEIDFAAQGAVLGLDGPVNLTRSPDSDDQILDAAGDRVLYATRTGERYKGAVLLDFGRSARPPEAGPLLGLLLAYGAWQAYGVAESPLRTDVALAVPAETLSGRLEPSGCALTQDAHLDLKVDVEAGKVDPDAAARVEAGGPPPVEPLAVLADVLRSSSVVGTARVVALEAAVLDLRDALLRLRHEIFPTEEDRLPVAPAVTSGPPPATGWPPIALQVPHDEAVKGEGEWVDPWSDLPGAPPWVEPAGNGEAPEGPLVLRTFLRVDPERPYERIHLFAFDTRRLGLHFVAGTQDPRSTTGIRGTGVVPEADRATLVATFNGGFKVEHGVFGALEPGRLLVPPAPGLATVALDAAGRARFGVWDAGPTVPPDVSALRQNLPPLIVQGVVNPQRTHNWGQLVSRLDDTQTPRTGLGVTDGGVLLFAWARAASAESLGEALRRAGATFALHLDMNPTHTGLELYRGEGPVSLPGAPEMDFRERRWLGTDARDFFYLTATPREQRPTAEPQDLGVATPEGADAPVRLWRLDAARPQVIPGLAEPSPAQRGTVAPRVVKLRSAPVFWIDTGLRPAGDRFGLVVGGRVWRAPSAGEMTLSTDEEGAPHVSPWPEGGEVARRPELVQGPALVRDARIVAQTEALGDTAAEGAVEAEGAHAPAPPREGGAHAKDRHAGPGHEAPAPPQATVAIGQDARGRLLVASGSGVTPVGLAQALLDAGAVDAVLLTRAATPETGRTRFFQLVGEKLVQSDRPLGRKEPADLRPRAGGVLVFTARALPPRARVVTTFRGEEEVSESSAK